MQMVDDGVFEGWLKTCNKYHYHLCDITVAVTTQSWFMQYSKTCVKWPNKKRQNKILMTNSSLMQLKSIAKGSILQYF